MTYYLYTIAVYTYKTRDINQTLLQNIWFGCSSVYILHIECIHIMFLLLQSHTQYQNTKKSCFKVTPYGFYQIECKPLRCIILNQTLIKQVNVQNIRNMIRCYSKHIFYNINNSSTILQYSNLIHKHLHYTHVKQSNVSQSNAFKYVILNNIQ